MALINCKDCGKMIAETSDSCPHCGSKAHHENAAWHYFAVISLAIILLLWLFLRSKQMPPTNVVDPEQKAFELIYPVRQAGYRVDEFVRVFSRSADNSTYTVEVREIKGSSTTSGFKVDVLHHTVERRW